MAVPRRSCLPFLLVGAGLTAPSASPAHAQQEADGPGRPPPGCHDPEHRQFDFWVGEWEVRNPDDQVIGHNSITRVADGCGLLEQWHSTRGGSGVSINMYEPGRGEWTQTWVGTGSRLRISGGLQDGRMVMTGEAPRETPDGEVLDRITWTPLDDGRVRQQWDVSGDEGSTWRTIFLGLYSPVDPAGG